MSTPTTDRGGIQQTIRALVADGWALTYVFDGEERTAVANETAAIEAITAVDESRLYVRRDGYKGWVHFVLGNSPEEIVADFTTNLTCVDVLTEGW